MLMKEKIARALGTAYDGHADPDATPNNWRRAVAAADAVLEAMMTPDEKMLEAGADIWTQFALGKERWMPSEDGAEQAWQAMITSARKGEG